MLSNKPLALTTLLVLTAIVQARNVVTMEPLDQETKEKVFKPYEPKFACSIKERSCHDTDDFMGIRNKGFVHLYTCHTHGAFSAYMRWTLSGGWFYNTYYAACENKDPDCEKYVEDHTDNLGQVAEDIRQSIKDFGDCNPKVSCFTSEDSNKHCFNKNGYNEWF